MIIIIRDGSCIAQIFPSRKVNALAHTIHANIHTDINIMYPSTHTHTHTHHGPPRFVEMPVEKRKVLSWVLKSERVGRLRKLAGNEFQAVGAMKLKERSPTDLRLRLGIFKSFSFYQLKPKDWPARFGLKLQHSSGA